MNTRALAITMQCSEQAIKNQLLRDALRCGGYSSVCIVEAVWAAHLRNAITEAEAFLSLAQRYTAARLEQAATRAIFYGQGTTRTVRGILRSGSDRLPMDGDHDVWGNRFGRVLP